MLLSIAVTLLFLSFFASVVLTGFFRNIANARNLLIDIPDKSRKFHFSPTPLVGGLSIHAAMLLSTFFMLSLVDYKYWFEVPSFSKTEQIQETNRTEETYSTSVQVGGLNGKNIRLQITPKDDPEKPYLSYNVSIGPGESQAINITPSNKADIFEVTLPNGQRQHYKITDEGVVEVNQSGVLISEHIEVSKTTQSFFLISSYTVGFMMIALLLQALILIDDAFGIKPWKRLVIQAASSLGVILVGGHYVESLSLTIAGNDMAFGLWGIPFTVFSVVGIINAFNMIDGIHGLCSGFALIATGALLIASGFNVSSYGLVIAMGSMIGFLCYNLGFMGSKRRVFLGDNGSTFLGFFVAWTCIYFSGPEQGFISPVTCLWIVAIPLLDCLGVMTSRAYKGLRPFSPGRDHIHHSIQMLTNSSHKTLMLLLGSGVIIAAAGIGIEKQGISSEISLMLFCTIAISYYFFASSLSQRAASKNNV